MKVGDYDLVGMPSSLQDVIEEIRIILNQGKYQFPTATADRTADGVDGEAWFVRYGVTARLEVFYDGAWYYLNFDGTI